MLQLPKIERLTRSTPTALCAVNHSHAHRSYDKIPHTPVNVLLTLVVNGTKYYKE